MEPDKLTDWLLGVAGTCCTRVEIRRMSPGSEGGSGVGIVDARDDGAAGDRFDLAAITAKLETDAAGMGGVQRYMLLAFREGAKTPRDTLVLRVDGGADGDPAASEPASLAGVLSQQMRHLESVLQINARLCVGSLEQFTRQNKLLSDALETATEEKVKLWGVMSEIAKSERENLRAKHEIATSEKRQQVLADAVGLLVPGLMAKLLPSHDARETALTKLVESLTPEQRERVFGCLTPDQVVALSGVLDTAIAKDSRANGASEGASS